MTRVACLKFLKRADVSVVPRERNGQGVVQECGNGMGQGGFARGGVIGSGGRLVEIIVHMTMWVSVGGLGGF